MSPLLDLSHTEARSALRTGAPVYLPVNPVEYHGPHLSLHNDALISQGIIQDLHARLKDDHPDWPLLLGTELEIGVDPVPGPGTRAVPYGEVRRAVVRACRALADLGARRVVIVTFHGSPLHSVAIAAGVRALRALGVPAFAPLDLLLNEMITLEPAELENFSSMVADVEQPEDRARLLRKLPFDFHAGFMETSLALHYAPHSVSPDYVRLAPCPEPEPAGAVLALSRAARTLGRKRLAQELEFAAHGLGWYALRPFPGYTSEPSLARASAGARFADLMAERASVVAEAVLVEGAEPAPPVMPWTAWLTAGGRVGSVHVPNDQILELNAATVR